MRSIGTQAPSPLAWTRAAAFGVAGSSIGVIGHAASAGTSVEPALLVVAAWVLTLAARIVARYSLSAMSIACALAAAQVAVHLALRVASSPSGAAPGHSMHEHVAAGGVVGAPVWMHAAPVMVLVHLGATLACAFILARLDRAAWSRVASISGRVHRSLARLLRPARASSRAPTSACLRRRAFARDQQLPICRWQAASTGRRGPPGRLLAAR